MSVSAAQLSKSFPVRAAAIIKGNWSGVQANTGQPRLAIAPACLASYAGWPESESASSTIRFTPLCLIAVARKHRVGVSPLVEIRDENEVGFRRVLNLLLAIGERRVDIRPTAQLHAEEDFCLVHEAISEVHDRRIEADELCGYSRNRCHHSREYGRIHDRLRR